MKHIRLCSFGEQGCEGFSHQGRSDDVCPERIHQLFLGFLVGVEYTGIVQQHVDPAELLHDALGGLLDGFSIIHIHLDG